MGSLIVALEFLVAHAGSSPLVRDQPGTPALGGQSLSHWITREVSVNKSCIMFL